MVQQNVVAIKLYVHDDCLRCRSDGEANASDISRAEFSCAISTAKRQLFERAEEKCVFASFPTGRSTSRSTSGPVESHSFG